jgi:3-dehydrosphinganine reductase
MEVLRCELKPHGIYVACVFPPDMDTPGFAAENQTKPEECARISSGIKPRHPDDVARAVLRGLDRRRFMITADPQTAVLARAAGILSPVLHRVFDRTVKNVSGAA